MTATVTIGNTDYYSQTVSNVTRLNIIFNNGKGGQTADITGITKDSWFSYDGNRSYQQLDAPTSISDIADGNASNARFSLLFPLNIYTLAGVHVATVTNMSQLHQLQPGVYVAGKQKIVIR